MNEPSALLAARRRLGWSQEQTIVRFESLARSMGIELPTRASLRTLLSLFENRHRPVPHQYRVIFRELYRSTDDELGLTPGSNDGLLPTPPPLPAASVDRATPGILDYLTNVLFEHVRADTMIGPQYLIPTVQSMLPLVERICESSRDPERERALSLGARFAQFCGWLYQDAGRSDAATYWTDRALDYAQELGDLDIVAYIFMRKSNIATDIGRPGHALGLANASLSTSQHPPPLIRAVSLRQHARAHAMLSERKDFERSIDEALASAHKADSQKGDLGIDPAGYASYCTPGYVTMEAGISWTDLGYSDRAVDIFRDSLATWPETRQARDRGLCLARLATASAASGDKEGACDAAEQALAVAKTTGSARIRSQLTTAYHRLTPLGIDEPVAELGHQLQMLAGQIRK